MTDFYRWQDGDLILDCHLQPKASRDEFCGRHGDSLKVRIQAPPIEGRANAQLIRFLAKAFGVAKSDIEILSGELGRRKRVKVTSPARLPGELQIAPPA